MDKQRITYGTKLVLVVALLIRGKNGFAVQPDWIKQETFKSNGKTLSIICNANGPSLDIGRRLAINSCITSAADTVNSSVKIQSLSIETERDTNYHSEISSDKKVTGLICDPENEYSEVHDDSYQVWIKCIFDLSKAKVANIDLDEKPIKEDSKNGNDLIQDKKGLSNPHGNGNDLTFDRKIITSENKQLILTAIPCTDILIKGKRPRSEKCNEMPKTLFLYPSDTELIIRASGGYLPKHVKLNANKSPGSNQTIESLEVYLERE